MLTAAGHMYCLECGHHWEVEALLEDDSTYLILDDICPVCEAQGEPELVTVVPEVTTRIEPVSSH